MCLISIDFYAGWYNLWFFCMRKSILSSVVYSRDIKSTTNQRSDTNKVQFSASVNWLALLTGALVRAFYHLSHCHSFPSMTDCIPQVAHQNKSFLFKFILLRCLDIAVLKLTSKYGICETMYYVESERYTKQFFSLPLPLHLYPS